MMINTNFNSIGGNWWNMGNSGVMNNSNSMLNSFMQPFGVNTANTSQNFRSSFLNVRNSAENLRTSLHSMMGIGRNASSPFGVSRPTSGDTDLMSVSNFDTNRLRHANVSDFSVDITQLATAQRNEGASLTSADLAVNTGFTQGNNQISLNVGGRQFDINFNVSATDTNHDVQQRIAGAINSRGIGVSANVSRDTNAGTSSLVLQSRETGVDRAGQPNFTVSGGGAADVVAVGNITQQAQNAEFRVNRGFTGALQTSRSNDVNLGFGISAQLRDTGNVEVNMTRDETAQINSFRDLVNNFNALMQSAQDNSNARGTSRLEQQLSGLVGANAASLNRAGITMNRDGFLTINETQMRTAAQNGTLERLAQDGGSRGTFGFVNRLERTVDNAIRNPAALMNDNQFNQNSNRHFHQMNQLMHTGMLFNAWF